MDGQPADADPASQRFLKLENAAVTSQFQDEIEFRSATFAITAIDGEGLFNPADHDLQVEALSSACWRGYICT